MQVSLSYLLVLVFFLPVTSTSAAVNNAEKAKPTPTAESKMIREQIFALQRNELPKAALEKAEKNQELFTAAELRGFQADYLAELTRLATLPTRQISGRYDVADRAIAEYNKLIPAWQALGPDAQADALRLRLDRIQALHARALMQEVVQEYELLRSQGVTIPRYILNNVASAYLYLRQPEKARDLYQQALDDPASQKDNPAERLANQTGLFYSLVESENFDQATQVIDLAKAQTPIWIYPKGSGERLPNDLRLYAEQTAAMGLLYADNTEQAQQKLQEMVDTAPNHSGLRVALARTHMTRQQPRLAEQQLDIAEAIDPTAREVIAAQARLSLELQEWRQAELLIQDLGLHFPEELQTQELVNDWEVHNKSEVIVSGLRGLASDNPVAGNDEVGIDAVMYSSPLAYNWRVFAGGGYASSQFEEGNTYYGWQRGGVEWRSRNVTAELELSNNNYGYGNKLGARATVAYDLNDQWQIGASAALMDRATPLRALGDDVTSNSVSFSARWRANEQREWALFIKPSHFSDGNHRLEASLNGRERLYTSPHFKADLLLSLAASRNSQVEAYYFNPRSDLEVMPAVRLTHTIFRRYDTVLEHNLLLGAGIYKQQDYGSGAIYAVAYGMRYRSNKTMDIGATITGVSRPYDGVREGEIRVMFDMNLRF